jgi:2-polyprenyl-6-methoxyphenol hydroxylase-like FAD-dependent oxidoreductase
MDEPVLVIGAGIAGLCTALALGPTGRPLTILERDPEPPSGDADEAFRDWNRRGVGHLRQSHAFLARLGKVIKADHPALRDALLEMGVRELGFESMLWPSQKATYVKKPVDAEFTLLTSRRTTLELVMRRYVETLPNVTIRSGAMVRELLTERDPSGVLKVVGVRVDEAGGAVELRAPIVIDAGGKNSSGIEQLIEQGAPIAEESETAGILYFTRHYRLRPGKSEPPREGNPPSGGDLGYLKFGVFPGDNNCFSVTMCAPEIEYELRKAIVRPEVWDKMIDNLPGLKVWCDAEQAEPTSRVFGMGDLLSRRCSASSRSATVSCAPTPCMAGAAHWRLCTPTSSATCWRKTSTRRSGCLPITAACAASFGPTTSPCARRIATPSNGPSRR